MNRVAAFALRRRNSILSMSEKMFCPPQPLRFWITPACAGKRLSLFGKTYPEQDHPRVCGEKVTGIRSQTINEGSPPRMRGKVFEQVYTRIPFRITPACAGKSIRPSSMASVPWDHPRVCGEKADWTNSDVVEWGSPLRMRGKAGGNLMKKKAMRITPAHAGKSPCS